MVGMILAGLAALVLALVAIGVYGTVSYRIASIRHEIGIHLALGADTVQVVRAVVAPLARVVAISVSLGSVLTLPSREMLDRVTVAVTALAAWRGPLRSALATDPSLSLRTE